jgi:hypothetical protein
MRTSTLLRRSHRRPRPADRERRRVAGHIARAARAARRNEPPALAPATTLARALLLHALDDYRAEGRFPKNHDWPWEMPAFIDHGGVRCAMAHLMELGGAAPLVAEIAAQRNHAFVRELADDPRVVAWLEAAGISVDEAAAIQPSYCAQSWSDCICGSVWSVDEARAPADVVLEGVVVAAGSIRIDAVYGTRTDLVVKVGDTLAADGVTVGDHVLVVLTKAKNGAFFGVVPDGGADAGTDGGTGLPQLDGYRTVIALAADGRPKRCDYQREATLPITKDQVVAALRTAQCTEQLAKTDSGWAEKPPCKSGGCSVADGGIGDASVAVLLAVAGAIVVKRRILAR